MIKFLRGTNTSDATATETDIRVGKTAYNASGKVEGQLDFTGFDDYNRCDEVVDEILNGSETTGLTELNLFVQEEEPIKKEGIWLQTNKPYEHIFSEKDVFAGEMYDTVNTISDFPTNLNVLLGCVNNELYMINTKQETYKYNIRTKQWSKLSNIPISIHEYHVRGNVIGTDIYLLGLGDNYKTVYKYDTLMDKYILLNDNISSSPPSNIRHTMTTDGVRYIYYIYADSNYNSSYATFKIMQYDILTNKTTDLFITQKETERFGNMIALVNNILYIFGVYQNISGSYISNTAYSYNIETKSFKKLANVPISMEYAALNVANDAIYLFNDTYTYKYDIETNTYINISNKEISNGYMTTSYDGENIYILSKNLISILSLRLKDYPDKSIVISQGGYDKFTVLLKNSNIEGNILQYFRNAWYYTTEGNVDMTIPTYYGDGTKWIQFK